MGGVKCVPFNGPYVWDLVREAGAIEMDGKTYRVTGKKFPDPPAMPECSGPVTFRILPPEDGNPHKVIGPSCQAHWRYSDLMSGLKEDKAGREPLGDGVVYGLDHEPDEEEAARLSEAALAEEEMMTSPGGSA
jgi:hypothetical protein